MKSYQLIDGKDPMSYAEIDRLAELARELPPDPVIVNIGADIGVSTCTFLEARPDCYIYSIDVLPCPAEFDNADRFGFVIERIKRVNGDSVEAGKQWAFQVDMVFVDGSHWGAGEDAKVWKDKVKPGGIMAYHDYQEVCPPNNPGSVYEDVNKEMAGYEQIGVLTDRLIAFRMK